jgi:hypothetical protein
MSLLAHRPQQLLHEGFGRTTTFRHVIFRFFDLDLYDLGFLSAPPNASWRCAIANEQGGNQQRVIECPQQTDK